VAFNLAVNLCHLERFEEAQEWVEEARNLGRGLGNDLDSLRVAWLSARVDAGRAGARRRGRPWRRCGTELIARGDALARPSCRSSWR
jgi:hypothetical protein